MAESTFTYMESTMQPLAKVDDRIIKKSIIDPTTGKPYEGLILEGIAADLSGTSANNNNRIYDKENYLEFIKLLKTQIFSPKGVYGEFEHPEKGYNIKGYNVSHKLLDVWYDETTEKVWIRILVLNTPNGLIIQDIIKSGGQVAISARAAGEEVKSPDGVMRARIKLLVTFDVVYHPGFAMANLSLVSLNESLGAKNIPLSTTLSVRINDSATNKITPLYEAFLSSGSKNCFLGWLAENKYDENLNEAQKDQNKQSSKQQKQQQKQQQKMQDNEVPKQNKIEGELEKAADDDLSEANDLSEADKKQQQFFKNLKQSQNKLKYSIQGKSFYDNSAGFMVNEDGDDFEGENNIVNLLE